jgi:hypothetical protein
MFATVPTVRQGDLFSISNLLQEMTSELYVLFEVVREQLKFSYSNYARHRQQPAQ